MSRQIEMPTFYTTALWMKFIARKLFINVTNVSGKIFTIEELPYNELEQLEWEVELEVGVNDAELSKEHWNNR